MYVWAGSTDAQGLTDVPDQDPQDLFFLGDGLFSTEIEDGDRTYEIDPHALGAIDADRGGAWDTLMTEVSTITSRRDGIEDAILLSGKRIETDGVGAADSLIGSIGEIEAGRDGLVNSSAEKVGHIDADGQGIVDSHVGRAGSIRSHDEAINDSEIGKVGGIETAGTVALDSSVEYMDLASAGTDGIARSEIGQVNQLYSDGNAVNDSHIDEARFIAGHNGLVNSSAEKVGHIRARGYALHGSDVGSVTVINSDEWAGYDVSADSIGQVVSEDWETDADASQDSRGFKDSDIGEIGSLNVYQDALVGSTVTELGDVTAAHNGIIDSSVSRLEGDLDVENQPVLRSKIDSIEGDVQTDTTAFIGSDITTVYGDITAETVFEDTAFTTVLSDRVDAQHIGDAPGNLVVTDELRTDDTGEALTVTPTGEGGDIELEDGLRELKELLRTSTYGDGWDAHGGGGQLVPALQLYGDRLDQGISTLDELRTEAHELVQDLPDLAREAVMEAYDTVAAFDDLRPSVFSGLLEAADDAFEDQKHERVQRFGETYGALPEEYQEELVDVLSAGDHPGKDLFDIGRSQEFMDFAEEPADQVQQYLDGSLDAEYEIDDFFGADSPYRTVLAELLDEEDRADELAHVQYLAAETGTDLTLDTEQLLKKWEGQRQHTDRVRDIDRDELRKRLDAELASKRRAYLKEALIDLGRDEAGARYRQLTDDATAELDADTATLMRAHSEYFWNREAAEQLLDDDTDIYETRANRDWIEDSPFTREDLDGPGEIVYETNLEAQAGMDEFEHDIDGEAILAELGPAERDRLERVFGDIDRDELLDDMDDDGLEYGRAGQDDDYEPPAGGADEITVRVAGPMEAVRMGEYFNNSCFKIGKVRGWSAVGTAVDANKHVIYAERDGQVIGRKQVAFTEDDRLSTYSTFSNTEGPVDDLLEDYAEAWADDIGVEKVSQDKDVEVLEAERWHRRVL